MNINAVMISDTDSNMIIYFVSCAQYCVLYDQKDYIIISKIENIKSEEWINILRKNLKDKYFIVETCSGYFDYSLVKTRKILGIGGKPSQHTSYLTHFITEEELGKISENNIINSIDKYKI